MTDSRTAAPILSWASAREDWGPLVYRVSLDGSVIAQTSGTSLAVPPLIDGPHSWQVTAVNLAGATSTGAAATVWVDTTPPHLQMGITGRRRVGALIDLSVAASDLPDPVEPGARASGIASVSISWGDGAHSTRRDGATHRYRRPGVYRIVVGAKDRVGNQTTISRVVRITR